jgi:hypothetical protein
MKSLLHKKWLGIPLIGILSVILVLGIVAGVCAYSAWQSCNVTTTGSFNVVPVSIVSIQVSPSSGTVEVGGVGATQQFTATGTQNSGETGVALSGVTWTSSNTAVATVNSTSGLATAVSAGGPVTITATYGTLTSTAQLAVTDTCDWAWVGDGNTHVVRTGSMNANVNFVANGTIYGSHSFTATGTVTSVTGDVPVPNFQVKNIGSTTINSWVVSNIAGLPAGLTNVQITVTSSAITTGNTASLTITLTATAPATGTVNLSGGSFTLTPSN